MKRKHLHEKVIVRKMNNFIQVELVIILMPIDKAYQRQ